MTQTSPLASRRALLPPADLPAPVATPFSSGVAAACRGADPEIFFDDLDVTAALSVCEQCPVRAACLAYAMDSEVHGVWGGATAQERDEMREVALTYTPEDRQVVWDLRDRIRRGDVMAAIASDTGVTERTLYRWVARIGHASEVSAAA